MKNRSSLEIYKEKELILRDLAYYNIKNKRIISYLIEKYNYKFNFSSRINEKLPDENYIKFIIDNTNFNCEQFDYNNFVFFLTNSINVINSIKLFEYAFSKYTIKKTNIRFDMINDITIGVFNKNIKTEMDSNPDIFKY